MSSKTVLNLAQLNNLQTCLSTFDATYKIDRNESGIYSRAAFINFRVHRCGVYWRAAFNGKKYDKNLYFVS